MELVSLSSSAEHRPSQHWQEGRSASGLSDEVSDFCCLMFVKNFDYYCRIHGWTVRHGLGRPDHGPCPCWLGKLKLEGNWRSRLLVVELGMEEPGWQQRQQVGRNLHWRGTLRLLV